MKLAIKDFFGSIVYGCGIAFVIQNGVAQIDTVTESRMYRDFVGETPFYDVIVDGSFIDAGQLVTFGEMKKRRCNFADLSGVVTFKDGPSQRALIDTTVEDARGVSGNRIPSSDAQSWGPWSVVWPDGDATPDGWRIVAGHMCPFTDSLGDTMPNPATGLPLLQYETNVFAQGPWKTTDTPKRQ